MSNFLFSIFYNENFVDFTLYQYGWESCDSGHLYGPATRNHYLFHYIISGKGKLIATNENQITTEYILCAGQGFLITPDTINTYIADQQNPWEYVWLEFDGLKVSENLELAGLSVDQPIYKSKKEAERNRLKEEMLYIAQHPEESSLCLIGHLYLFMDALVKSSATKKTLKSGNLKDFYIRESIHFIEQYYKDPITIEDIASYCNLNRSYFGKLFKESLNISPQEFLIKFRMTKACELLRFTNKSIGEISHCVGYENQLHFSRAFKKEFQISPKLWRNSCNVLADKTSS